MRNVDRGIASTMRTGHAVGKWLCVEACWRSKRIVRDTEWIYRSLTQNRFSLVPAFLFCIQSAYLRDRRAKMHSSNVKIGTNSDVAVFRAEESRKCNLPVARAQIAETVLVSTAIPGVAFAQHEKRLCCVCEDNKDCLIVALRKLMSFAQYNDNTDFLITLS